MEMHNDGGLPETEKKTKAITARQKQYLEAYKAYGSAAKAAKALGVTSDSVVEALRRVARAYGKSSVKELKEGFVETRLSATPSELMRLIKKQDYRCALSGEKLTPNTAELDHMMPRSLGGSDTIENLQWLDKEINRMKGQMSVEQFIAACRRVAAWSS